MSRELNRLMRKHEENQRKIQNAIQDHRESTQRVCATIDRMIQNDRDFQKDLSRRIGR